MSENGYFKSRVKSIQIALDGMKYVLMSQQNARIHAGFTLVVCLFGFLFKINRLEWIALLLTVGLVWAAEILNTAIEVMVDLISPEENPIAKRCKDLSAGGVLFTVIISVLVGVLIFGPPLWQWIRSIYNLIFF